MRRIFTTLALAVICCCVSSQNAADILDGFRHIIETSGIRCVMSIPGSDSNAKASIVMKGSRYTVTTPENAIWYNGKTLYEGTVIDGKIVEVYVSTPSEQELEEASASPYLVLKDHSGFDLSMPDKSHIVMTAKDTGNGWHGVRSIEAALTSNGTPATFTVTLADASATKIPLKVEKFETNISVSDREFTFQAAEWPDAEIIDLR